MNKLDILFVKLELIIDFLIRWIKNEYNNPKVYITENGWSDYGEMIDDGRIEYFHDHLHAIKNAIANDGCNVKAFTGNNSNNRFIFNFSVPFLHVFVYHFIFYISLVTH